MKAIRLSITAARLVSYSAGANFVINGPGTNTVFSLLAQRLPPDCDDDSFH